jgi:hypothetical protein
MRGCGRRCERLLCPFNRCALISHRRFLPVGVVAAGLERSSVVLNDSYSPILVIAVKEKQPEMPRWRHGASAADTKIKKGRHIITALLQCGLS